MSKSAHINCYVHFLRSLSDDALSPVMLFDCFCNAILSIDKWFWRFLSPHFLLALPFCGIFLASKLSVGLRSR
jgi:hypothetical protein